MVGPGILRRGIAGLGDRARDDRAFDFRGVIFHGHLILDVRGSDVRDTVEPRNRALHGVFTPTTRHAGHVQGYLFH